MLMKQTMKKKGACKMNDDYNFWAQAWSKDDIEIKLNDETIWLTKKGLIELINLLVKLLGQT